MTKRPYYQPRHLSHLETQSPIDSDESLERMVLDSHECTPKSEALYEEERYERRSGRYSGLINGTYERLNKFSHLSIDD